MIPISKKTRLKYTDEKTGVTYEFKPMTGENQIVALEALQYINSEKENVDIRKRAEHVDRVINTMLVGWSGNGAVIPPFEDQPADCFDLTFKMELFGIMFKLNNLTGDESKN